MKWLLAVIIFLAAFLRFWQVSSNPPSLTWDEAAWGYNAYSLGLDWKDEFGRFLPYDYIESFGDFKPPTYAYLDILPVKFFGLNELTVRFPSAFFGTLTILCSFFLVRTLFYNSLHRNKYGVLTALILAISPWHIMLSRGAFEANIATFFIIMGIWFFLESIRGCRILIILSTIFFVLSIYTFNSARVVSPILLVVLTASFKKELFRMKTETIISFVVGIAMILPITGFLFSPSASLRFKEVNIFSDISVIKRINQDVQNDGNAPWSRVIHNRRFVFFVEYLRHYFDHFNPRFLFITGDGNPKFSIQEVGQLYIWEIPFLIGGVLFLFKRREGYWWIIPVWLLVSIIPAATARETPHALRIENSLPTFQVFVAYGIVQIFQKISMMRKIFISLLIIVIVVNITYFLHDYYINYPVDYSHEWQYGYKESVIYAKSMDYAYDKVVVTEGMGRPYIYYLFFTKTDSVTFRKESKVERDAFGFVHVKSVGKYEFVDFPASVRDSNKKILYIDTPNNVPSGAKILRTFYFLNKKPSLVAYEQ